MKKQILFLSCLIGAVLLTSCEKETLAGNESIDLKSETIKKVVFNLPANGRSPEGSTTMLQFSTMEDFISTTESLEQALEAHQDSFYDQYEHLDDNEFDAIMISEGFNEYQPLIDFKEEHGFTNSMFDLIQAEMVVWEQSESSIPENDPEGLSDFDPIEQVLFNADGEVMIAGRIYSFGREDYDYEITDEYEASLVKIYHEEDVSDDPNIISTNKHDYRICYSNRRIQDFMFFPNNNNRRVQRRVVIRNYSGGLFTHTKAIIISYKKKSNGSWTRSRSYIAPTNESKYNTMSSCSRTSISSTKSRSIKKRKRRAANIWKGNSPNLGMEKNYGLKGTFRYGSTSSASSTISTVKYLE